MTLKICSLASGSSGNATFVSSGCTSLLVDCGASAREVTARLASIGSHPSQLDGILISHAHSDHYRAAGTLHARFGLPVYVDPMTARVLIRRGRSTSWKRIRETRPIPDRIGDIEVLALDTSHGFPPDEGRTVAYVLSRGSSSVGVVTDLGMMSEELIQALRRVDALILEANYDEGVIRRKLADPRFTMDWPYLSWVLSHLGHLSNRQCAEALACLLGDRPMHVYLGHLSENHNDPRRDNNSHEAAFSEVRRVLAREGIPEPYLHRTNRIGREQWGPSLVIEV